MDPSLRVPPKALAFHWVMVTFFLLACGIAPSNVSIVPESTSSAEPIASESSPQNLGASGRIAVVGRDGNLYMVSPGGEPEAITTDGQIETDQNRVVAYTHPTWSPQGWLSFVRVQHSGNAPPEMSVLARKSNASLTTLYSAPGRSYIYGYWSPASCSDGEDCGRFAFLLNESDSIAMHLVQVSGATNERVVHDEVVGRSQPFYYSWSPDGNSMLWHQDGQSLAIYDVVDGQLEPLPTDSLGLFQAPAWSPVDQRLLFAIVDDNHNLLTVVDGERQTTLATSTEGMVVFSWSPDGQQIAFAGGSYPYPSISIISANGNSLNSYDSIADVIAFFWSPNSQHIAAVTAEDYTSPLPEAVVTSRWARPIHQTDSPDLVLVWWLIDVESGNTFRLAQFFPTAQEFYLLQFADQYAQSHQVWSPDSRYIAYGEVLPGQSNGVISLLDTMEPGKPAIQLMDGEQAIFSFNP